MHAFLILAHAETDSLYYLIESILSDERARVYLHLDSKCCTHAILTHYISNHRVIIMPRHNLAWGHTSIMWQEIRMLRRAYDDGCAYFWTCSGQDAFCQKVSTCIDYVERYPYVNFVATRVALPFNLFWYHIGIRGQGRRYPQGLPMRFLSWQIEHMRVRKLGYDKIAVGSQWWTINRVFAKGILQECRRWRFIKTFALSWMSDETFVPMLALNLGYPLYNTASQHDTLCNNFRLVDFVDTAHNAPPRTYGIKDINEVLTSGAWIVRKVDDELAQYLYRLCK